jgi:aminopeptidase YwaD
MIQKSALSLLLWLAISACAAQKLRKADLMIQKKLENHVSYLASDQLEGRRTGTRGEKFAMEYIAAQFQQAGLQPMGDKNNWYQPFDIIEGKAIAKTSYLFINGEEIKPGSYFPMLVEAKQTIEAAPSIALRENGVPWFLNIKDSLEKKHNQPFNTSSYIAAQATEAAKKGATAFFVYNTSQINDSLQFQPKEKQTANLSIPILYIDKKIALKYFKDESATLDIKLKMVLEDKKRIGYNVIGYINNNAANTVIIGAHFDHLGFREDNNTLYKGTEKLVFNGANDNASGTAAIIELAKWLKLSTKLTFNNYLFVAFSAQELGGYGANYFTEHPPINSSKINCMINIHGIGRLNDTTKRITIEGYNTSPQWPELLNKLTQQKDNYFTFQYDSTAMTTADHYPFYKKNIPILGFSTGMQPDYHLPTDDAIKINYTNLYRVVRYIYNVVAQTNHKEKLVFTPLKENTAALQ